jgi:hypothetical protein
MAIQRELLFVGFFGETEMEKVMTRQEFETVLDSIEQMRIGDVLELGDSRIELYIEPEHMFTKRTACICKIVPGDFPIIGGFPHRAAEGVLGAPISALLREIRHRVESCPYRYRIIIVD